MHPVCPLLNHPDKSKGGEKQNCIFLIRDGLCSHVLPIEKSILSLTQAKFRKITSSYFQLHVAKLIAAAGVKNTAESKYFQPEL